MPSIYLNDRELAAVLAGLRSWQCYVESECWPDKDERQMIEQISTNGGEFGRLLSEEIDHLCARVNTQEEPWVDISVLGGVAEYEASPGVLVTLTDYDNQEEE